MTVYIDKLTGIADFVAKKAFPNYTGKRYKIETGTKFSPNSNHWDGGSRTYQVLISRDGHMRAIPEYGNMFTGYAKEPIEIPPNCILVEHSIFCGKDMGLTFVVRPEELDTLAIPEKVELTKDEKLVLSYTRSRKSHYAGRNRKEMAQDDGKTARNKGRIDVS
jgi:hypothetical protein